MEGGGIAKERERGGGSDVVMQCSMWWVLAAGRREKAALRAAHAHALARSMSKAWVR